MMFAFGRGRGVRALSPPLIDRPSKTAAAAGDQRRQFDQFGLLATPPPTSRIVVSILRAMAPTATAAATAVAATRAMLASFLFRRRRPSCSLSSSSSSHARPWTPRQSFSSAAAAASPPPLSVCIVGSGPAGMYVADRVSRGGESECVLLCLSLPRAPLSLTRPGRNDDNPNNNNSSSRCSETTCAST